MALILNRTEAELAQFEAEGMPVQELRIAGLSVRRYDTPAVIEWYIERQVRRTLSH
jgi:phage terminase Nu1 subunit (DNA packaging protein)